MHGRGNYQDVEVDAGGHSHLLENVDQVLGADVSRGAWRKVTAEAGGERGDDVASLGMRTHYSDNLGGVSQVGDRLGRDEGGGLDAGQATILIFVAMPSVATRLLVLLRAVYLAF